MIKQLTVRDFYNFLCKWAPPSLSEEWDNVGLQVGSFIGKVSGILVSLDVTENTLWEAVEHEANLLVTHHPLFFKPILRLDDESPVTRCARLATQMGVNILSFHTNLDSTREGLNDLLARRLGLKSVKPLLPARDPRWASAGLGRIGGLPKLRLRDFIERVAKNLKIEALRFIGDPAHHFVQKVAVMTGSGGAYYREARAAGGDVLVTGDVKYHQALEALAAGLAVVDIGHFAGEIGMVPLVAGKLRNWTRQRKLRVPIHETKVAQDPFQFWSHKTKSKLRSPRSKA